MYPDRQIVNFQIRVPRELYAAMEGVRADLGLPTMQELGRRALSELIRPAAERGGVPALQALSPAQYRMIVDLAVLVRSRPTAGKVVRAILDAFG